MQHLAPKHFFPINLDLRGLEVLVVGCGRLAHEKAEGLAAAGAQVLWLLTGEDAAPSLQPDLATYIEIKRETFTPAHLDGRWLVISATGDDALDKTIWDEAEARGILANVADVPERCRFIYPSVLRRGDFLLTTSTGGASPAMARMLRRELEEHYHRDLGEILSLVGRYRRAVYLNTALPIERRREIAEQMAAAGFKARHRGLDSALQQELCQLSRQDHGEDSAQSDTHPGTLTLVGAGPGDPDLITVAGLKALTQADLVVYDRLVSQKLLEQAANADLLYVGKETGEDHERNQRRIEGVMLEAARAGKSVVRLKGGDPLIFGRLGEEIEAVRKAGIDVTIIPGITSATAAAASMQMPLTHRELASSVAFVTGTSADESNDTLIKRIERLSTAADTVVIYMGMHHCPVLVKALLAGGRGVDEPVGLVRMASTPEEERYQTTLGELAEMDRPPLPSPTIMIVGKVVALSNNWTSLLRKAPILCG